MFIDFSTARRLERGDLRNASLSKPLHFKFKNRNPRASQRKSVRVDPFSDRSAVGTLQSTHRSSQQPSNRSKK
jgi:hypothetical protein